jgi:hypothetical protein
VLVDVELDDVEELVDELVSVELESDELLPHAVKVPAAITPASVRASTF